MNIYNIYASMNADMKKNRQIKDNEKRYESAFFFIHWLLYKVKMFLWNILYKIKILEVKKEKR